MNINYRHFILLIFVSILSCGQAYNNNFVPLSSDNNRLNYSQAYNICSPYSHNATKRDCHFGSIYENYYDKCMHSKGFFNDEDLSPSGYNLYMQAYKECSNYANSSAAETCSYNRRYKDHYDKCMYQYGFSPDGERLQNLPKNGNNSPNDESYFQFDF